MTRLRTTWLACVAAGATLFGHIVAYLAEGRSLADGRHGYLMPSLDGTLAVVLLGFAILVARAVSAGRYRQAPIALPPPAPLWVRLALVQTTGFVGLERLEGHAFDLVGCAVEALTALVVVLVLALLLGMIERCAEVAGATYLRRCQTKRAGVWRIPAFAITPSFRLATHVGVRRFQRPPPNG